jgi:hypothetical protein
MQATLSTSLDRRSSAGRFGSIGNVMRLALALIFTAHIVYAQAVTVGAIAAVPLNSLSGGTGHRFPASALFPD